MMKKNIKVGLGLGVIAGILDISPMIAQKMTWDAVLAAFSLWLVVGFMVATSKLSLSPVPKGMVIAFLCLLPSIPIIGWFDPFSLLPVITITLILGALLSYIFHRLVK